MGAPRPWNRKSAIVLAFLCSLRPTAAARFGYMPPQVGRIDRSGGQKQVEDRAVNAHLSPALLSQIDDLFSHMTHNTELSWEDAVRYFRQFPKVSASAMFDEVDVDRNDSISRDEFR